MAEKYAIARLFLPPTLSACQKQNQNLKQWKWVSKKVKKGKFENSTGALPLVKFVKKNAVFSTKAYSFK